MKKITLQITMVCFMIGTLNLNAQVFEMSLTNKTESDAFVATLPTGFSSTGTISSNQWGGTYGVKIERLSSLTYTATGLAAGDYTIEGVIMVQNIANLSWIQDIWASGGTVSTPILQGGTSGSYITYTKTVTVPTTGDYTFGIVRANDGGQLFVKAWKVTSNAAGPSTETDITAFTLPQQTGAATIDAGAHTVAIEVAYGTGLTNLTPNITLSEDATISPLSGVTQDFSSPVIYSVTAEDGITMQNWTVTVAAAAASPETDITAFTLPEQTGNAIINADDHTIAIEVAYATELTNLMPTITLSIGATVSPLSGVAQDFSGPVTYSVTAEDGITMQDWTVTITIGSASTETNITSFVLAEQTGSALIDASAHTISLEVVNGTSLSNLSPTIILSTGATVSPLSGETQDFSLGAVTYTVTAQDAITTQDWAVSVNEAAPTVFSIVLANQSESDAFVASLPAGFASTGTISSSQWGGTYGVKIEKLSSLTYTATGLAPGDYTIEGNIMVQNTSNLSWIQDVWASGGTVSTPILQEGTSESYITYTKTVTVPTTGDYTFGIVRANDGGQLFVQSWKAIYLGTPLSADNVVLKNKFSISKTGVSLNDISGKVQIIDLLGRVLVSKQLRDQGTFIYNFNRATIYVVKLTTDLGSTTKKVVFN